MKIILAITGASGVTYGLELARALASHAVHLIVTRAAHQVLAAELDDPAARLAELGRAAVLHDVDDLAAAPASGSFPIDAMVVCPCSMRTLAAIAAGLADNLVTRAADVTLKERRRLILVPRETPLSAIHLENMLKLARLGVVILPACPGFYQRPQTIPELTAFVVGRVLDQLGLEHTLCRRWPNG